MVRTMLKSKIHRATVTNANVDYVGSITIDTHLMKAADILPYEKVAVVDIDNGARLETYAIEGDPGSGVIEMNGAAARLVQTGDKIIIMSYAQLSEVEARELRPTVVLVDEFNRPTSISDEIHAGEVFLFAE
ncbi:MAG TPA: aspartate 1-decarboxylase [Actinomycetota bacterium]|nr:aspartate 1-decarboxylase [Actinomycetota bacterium]